MKSTLKQKKIMANKDNSKKKHCIYDMLKNDLISLIKIGDREISGEELLKLWEEASEESKEI